MPNIDWDVFKETDDEDIVTDGQYAIDKDDPGYEPAVKPEEVKGKDNTLLIDLMSGSQDISVGDIVGFKAFVRDSKGTRYIGAFLDEEDFVFNEEDTDSGITYVLDLIDHLKNKFACSNVIVDCDVYLRDADNKVVADKFTELYVEEPTEQIEESVKKLKENVSDDLNLDEIFADYLKARDQAFTWGYRRGDFSPDSESPKRLIDAANKLLAKDPAAQAYEEMFDRITASADDLAAENEEIDELLHEVFQLDGQLDTYQAASYYGYKEDTAEAEQKYESTYENLLYALTDLAEAVS